MNTRIGPMLLVALAWTGCRHAPVPGKDGFPAILVARPPDKGSCGPSFNQTICGYLPISREGTERARFTCWHQPHEFYCEGCQRENRIQCQMRLPAEVKVGEPLPLRISLKNTSNTTLRLEPTGMPLSPGGFGDSTFHVHCDGRDEPWTGGSHSGNWSQSERTSYLVVPAGGTIENEINLQPFFVGMRGSCMVHWHGFLWDVVADDHPRAANAPTNRVTVDCNWAVTRVEP